MIRFDNDYTRGAHPKIIERLTTMQDEQNPGYGVDDRCKRAAELIKEACQAPHADVHLLVGGTQTNLTVISSILRPHEAVLAPETGHIATSETGAIEATGHKVMTLPTENGKITATQLNVMLSTPKVLSKPENIHAPKPGMIFLSQSTEFGGLYTKAELLAIKKVAIEYDLPLYIDGARLSYALAAEDNDVTLADLAEICDVFYIGGTKVGSLFGEAVVILNDKLKPDFRYLMKQRGALLAKGYLLGIQFETFFEDGLYFECGQHAISAAMRIKQAFAEASIDLRYPATTNQIFPILTHAQFEKLGKKYTIAPWERGPAFITVRICTDWSTKDEHVDELIADIKAL